MSQIRNTSSVTSQWSDGGEQPIDEPSRKQKKLEQCSQPPVTESELPTSGVGIEDLPDEILLRILSHVTFGDLVDSTQNVCGRWRRLSHDAELWLDKKFILELGLRFTGDYPPASPLTDYSSCCSDDDAVIMLQNMPQLRALEIRRNVKPSVVDVICDNCRRLTTLKINEYQNMCLPLLKKLVENCKNIQSLTLPVHVLGDECMAQTVTRLPRLQSLDVKAAFRTDYSARLRPFADGCPELVSLNVWEKVTISGDDVQYFINKKRKTLIRLTLPWISSEERSGKLSRLQALKVTYSDLVDSDLVTVCMHCPELKELILIRCFKLTDDAFRQLDRLSKLETLEMSDLCWLEGSDLRFVALLPKLRKLFLERLSAFRLKPGLESILDVTSLEFLSLRDMLANGHFPFDRLPGKLVNLRHLDVRGIKIDDDSILDRLQEQMPGLQVDRTQRKSSSDRF